MHRGGRRPGFVIATLLVLFTLAGAPVGQASEHSLDLDALDPNPDLELIAKGRGWTSQQALAQQEAADAVGDVATLVARFRPESFVGSALAKEPGAPPSLYIKGPADPFVRELIAASSVKIILVDEQPYSFDELESRKETVHKALASVGYANIVTRVNITGRGLIPAAVALEPGLPTDPAEILAAIPAGLRDSVTLEIVPVAGFADTGSFGGMWTRDSGSYLCTSGQTVRNQTTGAIGVTTAGHCTGVNEIVHPGHGVHTTAGQGEHRGDYGDVEWHTTSSVEEATFYAETTTIRPVLYLESRAAISENEQVCLYGRASDFRDCDLDVFDVSISCTLSNRYNNRLVQMTGITSALGDSGGGWFRDYRVFGSQKGWCSGKDAWTVADLYDEALNVRVVIYE